ncbi:peptidoglycan DD-metalloendopeptidase family protein [Oleiphilus messinensis]|nr:peptidoglycan DD-metalloendopeptidase family protein [Oleiphilus messinensis]
MNRLLLSKKYTVHKLSTAPGLIILVVLLLLWGCNSTDIYQDQNFNPPVYFGTHVVRKGDSMYSIAWRYGRDYVELANANGIAAPYVIQVGQKIRLDLKGSLEKSELKPEVTKRKPKLTKNNKQTNANKGKIKPKVTSKKVDSGIVWQWPHVGPVIARYSVAGNVNKGIDIAGKPGEPVLSAAAGEVVYAGSGLLGYGKLIIINHNDQYLSAYAHNRRILVKEGQKIRAGAKIAELGSTGTNRPKLHFEIRKKGNPVDPLRYLPARNL